MTPPPKIPADMISKTPSTMIKTIVLEPQMETPGIACWDFAYPTGQCSLPPRKNCFFSKRQTRSIHHERIIPPTIAPAHETAHGGQAQPKSKKHTKTPSQHVESKTYLLSSPTPVSITCPQTSTTISTLLAQPDTKLIYLVPQSNIVCPKVCEFMRLSRAAGSSFQVLPVPPEIDMMCGGAERCSVADAKNVRKVVEKVLKNTKVHSFDGYFAFEEEREAWTFLEHVGQGVKSAAKKG